jgi:NADP-dependent alcohol dehydrogenase
MNTLEIYNPTRLILGENKIETLNKYIDKNLKVMMVYGGGSIKKNGIYELVKTSLKNHQLIEFSGVEANPEFETLVKAVDLARAEQIDFIIAVGGGSVIDGVKFISAAIHYEGELWDILEKGGRDISTTVPFGSILTLPATGSEMNSGSVITRREIEEKRVFGHPKCFPVFSILDPMVLASLPQKQIANGIVDAFVHILEQYITDSKTSAPIQDGFAESLLKTLIQEGPKVFENPKEIEAGKNFMFAATMALNGLIGSGVPQDWATHMIGHELTAFFGIDHARTLAIVLPGVWEVMFESKKAKLAQYAKNVWQLEGTETELAEQAIEKTEAFFNSLKVMTRLDDYITQCYKIWDIPKRIEERAWKLGENQNIDHLKVEEILKTRI